MLFGGHSEVQECWSINGGREHEGRNARHSDERKSIRRFTDCHVKIEKGALMQHGRNYLNDV